MLIVIWNKKSGLGEQDNELKKYVEALRASQAVVILPVSEILDLDSLKKKVKLEDCKHILAIGGDGTINAAVQAAMHFGLTLGVIPQGTFNHFAKHTNIPQDLREAFAVFDEKHSQFIDVAEVNGVYFVNFSSIGFYSDIIANREKLQSDGHSKWNSFSRALTKQLVRNRKLSLTLTNGDIKVKTKTPAIFIGNNKFDFGSLDVLANRDTIQSGLLHVMMLKNYSRLGIMFLLFKSMFVNIRNHIDTESLFLQSLTINVSNINKTPVTVDGEVLEMNAPFIYQLHHEKLRVILPKL